MDITNQKYGAPDIKYAFDVLDGSDTTWYSGRPADRIQISEIEGFDRLSTQQFDWLVKGDAAGGPTSVAVYNLKTGILAFSGAELKTAMDFIQATVTSTPPAESFPLLRVALTGTLNNVTRGTIINRSMLVDGLGTAIVRRTTSYTPDSGAIFRLHCSNITIRNLTIEDAVVYTQAQLDAYVAAGPSPDEMQSQGIISAQPTPGCENWTFENLVIKNVHHHAINITRTDPIYTRNITIRNVVVDNMSAQDFGDSAFNIGVCSENVTISDCVFLQPHHGAIDIWSAKPPVRVLRCRIYCPRPDIDGRTQNGMAITAVSDQGDINPTEEVIVRDNWISGDALTQDCINVHGGSANVIVEGNNVEQTPTTTARFGIRVGGFTVFRTDDPDITLYAHDVIIRNNIIRNTYSAGIMVESDPAYPFTGVSIVGNIIENTRGPSAINLDSDAKHILIANNQIYKTNARQLSSPVGSGVYARINCPNTTVIGNNMLLDSNATYSVFEDGGATTTNNTFVLFNDLGGKPVSIGSSGVDSVVAVNLDGYRTENWGTATVGSGSTTQTVTHGLGFTPTTKNIRLVPSGDMGSASKFWISSPTSTQFTVNVDANPSNGSGAAFNWHARRN